MEKKFDYELRFNEQFKAFEIEVCKKCKRLKNECQICKKDFKIQWLMDELKMLFEENITNLKSRENWFDEYSKLEKEYESICDTVRKYSRRLGINQFNIGPDD